MEIVGLAIAIPAVIVANIGYALVARFGLVRFQRLRPCILWSSVFVLLLAVVDIMSVAMFGAVTTRSRLGPAFWWFHELVFVAGAPSLANVLVLTYYGQFRRWYWVAAVCCVFGVFLVFLQVGVGDALTGRM